ncbi:MAG TPA: hypothetical protein VEH47_08195 [Candidatus Acidoferrales bacterium]|nr:hypothetical protein [Candidatus Acidoferrales bacterium]
MKKIILIVSLWLGAVASAYGGSLICVSDGGYPYCGGACQGAEFCIISSDPPYCETRYDDCGPCEPCLQCGPGCCASSKNGKTKCGLKKTALALDGAPRAPTDHLSEFLADADAGVFDGKKIYMSLGSPLAKQLLEVPVSHWKSFTQKVVLKGWQPDKGLDPKLQKEGTPQILLEIETKTGHKLVIHLVDVPPMKKQS